MSGLEQRLELECKIMYKSQPHFNPSAYQSKSRLLHLNGGSPTQQSVETSHFLWLVVAGALPGSGAHQVTLSRNPVSHGVWALF